MLWRSASQDPLTKGSIHPLYSLNNQRPFFSLLIKILGPWLLSIIVCFPLKKSSEDGRIRGQEPWLFSVPNSWGCSFNHFQGTPALSSCSCCSKATLWHQAAASTAAPQAALYLTDWNRELGIVWGFWQWDIIIDIKIKIHTYSIIGITTKLLALYINYIIV